MGVAESFAEVVDTALDEVAALLLEVVDVSWSASSHHQYTGRTSIRCRS